MQISFLVNHVFDGWEPDDIRLGGTEEAVVRWAEEFTRRGHTVTVWRNPRSSDPVSQMNGVFYNTRTQYQLYGDTDDICISIKARDIIPAVLTLYVTTETDASLLDLSGYAAVVWPTQWAVDNIPVNNRTFIVPYGYDSSRVYPGQKIAKQCFYASSPDRGLDTLLAAWPQVYAENPGATLLLTYGAPDPGLPGIINLGEVNEATMDDIYRTSDVWCHPCNGGELYCMTGIKAQAAGCVPVVIPAMALAETVRHGIRCTKENYAEKLIYTLEDEGLRAYERTKLAQEHYPDWKDSTDALLAVIQKVLH